MNIQEFASSRTFHKLLDVKSSLENSVLEKTSSLDPNREKLSKLINECDYHENDIQTGLSTLNNNMQKYRLEQK
jgi:hypothetical protein